MVETLDNEPFVYPMMRTSMNVLIEKFPCFRNCLVGLLLEAQNLPTQGTSLACWEELLEECIGTLIPSCHFTLVGVEPLLSLPQV